MISFLQFIYGSFKEVSGGHQIVAQSTGISEDLKKKIQRIQPSLIGDFRAEDFQQTHLIWAPLADHSSVFAQYNFAGEDYLGRRGMINMHGVIIPNELMRELQFNPFALLPFLNLHDLESKIGTDLPDISWFDSPHESSGEILSYIQQNKERLAAQLNQLYSSRNLVLPIQTDISDNIHSLFELLSPKERTALYFSTYSNVKQQDLGLAIIGVIDAPSRPIFDGPSSPEEKKKIDTYILQKTAPPPAPKPIPKPTISSAGDRPSYPAPPPTPIPPKKKMSTWVLVLLIVTVVALGFSAFLYLFMKNSIPPVDTKQEMAQNVDPVIDSLQAERDSINEYGRAKTNLNIRALPSDTATIIDRIPLDSMVFCAFCLTQVDSVRKGCIDSLQIEPGHWCQVRRADLVSGWVWSECLELNQ